MQFVPITLEEIAQLFNSSIEGYSFPISGLYEISVGSRGEVNDVQFVSDKNEIPTTQFYGELENGKIFTVSFDNTGDIEEHTQFIYLERTQSDAQDQWEEDGTIDGITYLPSHANGPDDDEWEGLYLGMKFDLYEVGPGTLYKVVHLDTYGYPCGYLVKMVNGETRYATYDLIVGQHNTGEFDYIEDQEDPLFGLEDGDVVDEDDFDWYDQYTYNSI